MPSPSSPLRLRRDTMNAQRATGMVGMMQATELMIFMMMMMMMRRRRRRLH